VNCPIKRKFCEPVAFKEYDCGSWFCAGVKDRKSPGGVKMDVVRLCGNTYFIKSKCFLECTPDEAARFSALLSTACADWLDDSEAYQVFIADNDK
jgi:hypothetical protein